jgi:succinoglycan biosynthesis transport protein ExoP
MPEQQFDLFEYLGYLRRRWLFCAVACAVAFAVSAGISLTLPKQYTATASILIDVSGAADPRASTAVSPVYMESLRTYEHFAESDSLFLEALDRFHLRDENPKASVDSLKRRVLKVTKPRDTKILQVSATLGDPIKAQALAQYVAERTVDLNGKLVRQSDQSIVDEAQRQLDAARNKTLQTEKAMEQETAREPYEALQAEVDNLVELQARLRRDLLQARVDVADYTAQGNQRELTAVRARVEVLEKQVADINRELIVKEKTAAERRARVDALSADLKAARAMSQAAEGRLSDVRSSAGTRSERLRIIDPGIVPQQPSSPSRTLIVIVAVFVGAVLAWLYLTVAFNFRVHARRREIPAYSAER